MSRIVSKNSQLAISILSATCYFACVTGASAHEVFHVKKLHVEKGHKEIEVQGAHFSGHPKEEEHEDEHEEEHEEHGHSLRHAHEAALFYGVSNWWKTGLALSFEKPLEEKFSVSALELKNTFVLLPETNGFGFGLTAQYGRSFEENVNSIELGTIASFESHNWDAALNTGFGRNLNGDETNWGHNYSAQIRFGLNDHWKIGVEAYGEIEDLKHVGSFDEQTHRVGPVIYWSSEEGHEEGHGHGHSEEKHEEEKMHLHTELGVLFGASDAANDITIKWGMGVSF